MTIHKVSKRENAKNACKWPEIEFAIDSIDNATASPKSKRVCVC